MDGENNEKNPIKKDFFFFRGKNPYIQVCWYVELQGV